LEYGFKNIGSLRGFTLVELIIVVGVIAILAAGTIAVLNPFTQFQKADDSRRKSDLSQIQKGLEVYYQDLGRYPQNATQCNYEVLGNNSDGNDCIEWGKSWQPYMNVVPKDPKEANSYVYFVTTDGQAYFLYANLSRGTVDKQSCNNGDACNSLSSNNIPVTACGGTCNYGISSPNVSP
jgi:type II secretion system protein G